MQAVDTGRSNPVVTGQGMPEGQGSLNLKSKPSTGQYVAADF